MTRGIERGEISTHARTHQGQRLVRRGPLDYRQLSGDREVFEVSRVQFRNFHGCAGGGETFLEKKSLARGRPRGEAVKIKNAGHEAHMQVIPRYFRSACPCPSRLTIR